METKTFKPHAELLKARKVSPEFFDQWAEWLETTKMTQATETMTEGENTACCLHVLECGHQNNGEWFNTSASTPRQMLYHDDDYYATIIPFTETMPQDLHVAKIEEHNSILVADLNDKYRLSFIQIAQILRGNEISVEFRT